MQGWMESLARGHTAMDAADPAGRTASDMAFPRLGHYVTRQNRPAVAGNLHWV